MATRDRYQSEPELMLEPVVPSKPVVTQGELFARLALRPLPVMKFGPEDALMLEASAWPRMESMQVH